MNLRPVRPLALAWMGMIFLLSALTANELPDTRGFLPGSIDKLAHAVLYAGLIVAFAPRPRARAAPSEWLPFAVAASSAFALLDEIHQMFVPGRKAEFLDLAADGVGIALAGVLCGAGWLAPLRRRIFLA